MAMQKHATGAVCRSRRRQQFVGVPPPTVCGHAAANSLWVRRRRLLLIAAPLPIMCHRDAAYKYVVIISVDFTKAFDRVRHHALSLKYLQPDLLDNIHNWLMDFFKGRGHSTTTACFLTDC